MVTLDHYTPDWYDQSGKFYSCFPLFLEVPPRSVAGADCLPTRELIHPQLRQLNQVLS